MGSKGKKKLMRLKVVETEISELKSQHEKPALKTRRVEKFQMP